MFRSIALLALVGVVSPMGLVGCASITTGTNQSVSVKTGSVSGAQCSLENNKGTWYIPSTPGSVVVNRSFNDLSVKCEKKGYPLASKSVSSSTKAMAFGNVVFGGVVGAGVDIADGAAYDYPNTINVPMRKTIA